MSEKPIILRRLKTRDGIVSPIEQIHEYKDKEYRYCKTDLKVMTVESLSETNELARRLYRTVKEVPAILLEMEEI